MFVHIGTSNRELSDKIYHEFIDPLIALTAAHAPAGEAARQFLWLHTALILDSVAFDGLHPAAQLYLGGWDGVVVERRRPSRATAS